MNQMHHVITEEFTAEGFKTFLRTQHAELGRYVEVILKGEVWTIECVSEHFQQYMITRGNMEAVYHHREMWYKSLNDPTWDFPYPAAFDHLFFVEKGFKNVVMGIEDFATCVLSYVA